MMTQGHLQGRINWGSTSLPKSRLGIEWVKTSSRFVWLPKDCYNQYFSQVIIYIYQFPLDFKDGNEEIKNIYENQLRMPNIQTELSSRITLECLGLPTILISYATKEFPWVKVEVGNEYWPARMKTTAVMEVNQRFIVLTVTIPSRSSTLAPGCHLPLTTNLGRKFGPRAWWVATRWKSMEFRVNYMGLSQGELTKPWLSTSLSLVFVYTRTTPCHLSAPTTLITREGFWFTYDSLAR